MNPPCATHIAASEGHLEVIHGPASNREPDADVKKEGEYLQTKNLVLRTLELPSERLGHVVNAQPTASVICHSIG